jgi:hypothetical protein
VCWCELHGWKQQSTAESERRQATQLTLWKAHLTDCAAPDLGVKWKTLSPERSSSRHVRMRAFSASRGLCLSAVVNCSVHSRAPPLWKIAK